MKFNSILKNTLIILALVFIAGIVSMSPVRTERVSAADCLGIGKSGFFVSNKSYLADLVSNDRCAACPPETALLKPDGFCVDITSTGFLAKFDALQTAAGKMTFINNNINDFSPSTWCSPCILYYNKFKILNPPPTPPTPPANPSTPNSTCVASCDNSTTVTCAPSTTICSADKSTTICADQSIKPVPCTPSGGSGVNDFDKLKNPLGDNGIGSLTDFIAKILNIIIMIGIPI